jgi:release factor glutamine methyltransferase
MPEVASFEPKLALDGGPDGLEAYRAIASAARELVTPDSPLVVEAGQGQAAEISRIFLAAGLSPLGPWKDLGGIERVVAARYQQH